MQSVNKRRICILICVLLSVLQIAACSAVAGVTDVSTGDTAVSEIPETTKADPFDVFTVNPTDLEGLTLNFLTRPLGTSVYVIFTDICAEETTGEPLNDAIYARNQRVTENYNVNFTWSEGDASHVQKSVLAQEDAYAFVNIALNSHISLANSGYLINL